MIFLVVLDYVWWNICTNCFLFMKFYHEIKTLPIWFLHNNKAQKYLPHQCNNLRHPTTFFISILSTTLNRTQCICTRACISLWGLFSSTTTFPHDSKVMYAWPMTTLITYHSLSEMTKFLIHHFILFVLISSAPHFVLESNFVPENSQHSSWNLSS